MNELEEILELLGEEQLEELKGELFLLLANCVASQHFQVMRVRTGVGPALFVDLLA